MTSDAGLFHGIYARGGAAAATDGTASLQAMLDVEAALARGCAAEGLISADSADAIVACCRADRFDRGELSRAAAANATPVVGLVDALRDHVGEPYAGDVHLGATSQDIADTAMMLVVRRALAPVLDDAGAAAGAAAAMAAEHRATPIIGRTLLQQALPTTFGLKAAVWLSGIDAASDRLRRIQAEELPVQMGGPIGGRPPAVAARVAAELNLAEPVLPWQAMRVPVVTLAGALATLAGTLAKVGRDVTLLAQSEVGECREAGGDGRGRSSAMAHKHNPVAAVSILACARRTPALAGTLLAGLESEHERAAGAWQAEWGTICELLVLTGSAAAWGRDLLEGLVVDPERMMANLTASGLAADPAPEGADELIDRALRAHRR